ncbi:MAG: LacI family DNA-binding transcriptional regulator [Pseudomonadota bacterium]
MTQVPKTILPTLEDVARAANVSTATVSRCLNDASKVTEDTRERVMQAVEQLGYTPNFGARALAAKRTKTIGAIIPTMENAIFARGIQAFQETLNESGYTLLVSSTGYDPQKEAEQIQTLLARGADGLLLIGYDRDPKLYNQLDMRQIRYLFSWAHRSQEDHPAIGFDNCKSIVELTKFVLQKGHRELAIISGVTHGNDRAADRVRGIRLGLAQAGIDPDHVPCIEVPYTIENGGAAFETLMHARTRPTAVMCVNDVLAVGAIQKAQDLGLNVPGDVSVTGFDDIEIASIVTPKLTTVHVPHRHMGSLAAQELINLIEQKVTPRSFQLNSSLRIRDSLAGV